MSEKTLAKAQVRKIVKLIQFEATKPDRNVDVFFNGRFIGSLDDHASFVKSVRNMRREGKLPMELSIRFDKFMNTVLILTEIGRVLRPLVVVDNGKS